MRCTKCDNPAVIKIPYANLYLCKEHFIEWFEKKVEKTIDKYHMLDDTKKLAVAVSGGKDSTTLLHVLTKIAQNRGIEVLGITIDLGIDMGTKYSRNSVDYAVKNYEMLGVKYRIVKLKEEYGFTIDEAKYKIRRPVCSTCGLTKRYILEKVAKEEGADTIATGHNLNDIAQYVITGYYNGDVSSLARLSPISPAEHGFVKKIKPLFLTTEKETTTYAIVKGIPFLYQSCPHTFRVGGETQDKLRRSIEEIEDKIPGFMMSLVRNFEEKIRPALIKVEKAEIGKCKICGMPTTANREICSFCAVRIKLGVRVSENPA